MFDFPKSFARMCKYESFPVPDSLFVFFLPCRKKKCLQKPWSIHSYSALSSASCFHQSRWALVFRYHLHSQLRRRRRCVLSSIHEQ